MSTYLSVLPFMLIVLTYMVYFSRRKKVAIFQQAIKWIKPIHYFTFYFGILLIIMSLNGYHLSYLWSDQIVAWLFLITACIIVVDQEFKSNKLEWIYGKILFFSPSILIISWIMPMFGALTCYSFSLFFYTDESTVIFNDKEYLFKFEEGFLVYDFDPTLYQKIGPIMKKKKEIELHNWSFGKPFEIHKTDEKSVQFIYRTDQNTTVDTLILF